MNRDTGKGDAMLRLRMLADSEVIGMPESLKG